MSDHETPRLTVIRAAVAGFFSGITRAVTAWVIAHVWTAEAGGRGQHGRGRR